MTLGELRRVSPQCFIFIRHMDGSVEEYTGSRALADMSVGSVLATEYPMFKHVLEVTLYDGGDGR